MTVPVSLFVMTPPAIVFVKASTPQSVFVILAQVVSPPLAFTGSPFSGAVDGSLDLSGGGIEPVGILG